MTPVDPHNRNQRTVPVEDFAALLDGEITDMHRIAQLKDLLQGDTSLSAEFDAQREVKLLLAGLPEAEAPSFMQTRILGEISARKKQRHAVWLPKWGAAAAAVAIFGTGYGAALQFASQQAGTVHTMVANAPEVLNGGQLTVAPAMNQGSINLLDGSPAFGSGQSQFPVDVQADVTGDLYQDVYASSSVEIPADTDAWLREFIELGNEAHNYSRAMRLTHNIAAPDVSQAVMVVDSH